jgi:hypothetical protein
MEHEPVQSINLTLTPQQWEALQEILQMQRHPRHIFPLANGTITFDEFPMLAGPIPGGTDLTLYQPFGYAFGVTFSADLGTGTAPGSVYAVGDFTGRSRNIVTLLNNAMNPWFNAATGAIRATFNPPVKSVSIDAYPAYGPEPTSECARNQPYLQAYDASGSYIQGSEVVYPIPGCIDTNNNPQQNPGWGVWQTLSINRAQDDIHSVEFSVQQGQGGPPIFGVFDNLSFQR